MVGIESLMQLLLGVPNILIMGECHPKNVEELIFDTFGAIRPQSIVVLVIYQSR
jgi:hypothetical protein